MMRSLLPSIEKDLQAKFVLLAGPRQVGKTFLAKEILQRVGGRYYNWDLAEDRQRILTKSFLQDGTVVLDELHKYDRWKNWTKGLFDTYRGRLKVLITGSARLDLYRRGADSLFGRYFLYHLHPLTLGELISPKVLPPEGVLTYESSAPHGDLLEGLMKWGGFPEPFYSGTEQTHNRWSLQRRELLVREDIRDLTDITLLSLVEHLMLLLPDRAASLLSVNSLKEDLQVAYNTVRSWLETFERLYITFTLKPFTLRLQRAVHKERKLYLWDWSQVPDEGRRFENLVASHLWKAVQLWRDLGFGDYGLHFFRDRDRREVDFCVVKDRKPWFCVEAKLSETEPAESLHYFVNRFQVPGIQLVHKSGVDRRIGLLRVVSADRWLPALP